MRLLLTRPETDAQRVAAVLRQRGHHVTLAPLLRIEPLHDVPISGGTFAAILITSINAARAIAAHAQRPALDDMAVFAVGDQSAAAMREAGFTQVISAGGGVEALGRLVAAHFRPPASLLYLAGEQRAGDLAGDLARDGFAVKTVVIYRAVAASDLPQAAAKALADGIDGVLHFSRRSAEAYLDAARHAERVAIALRPVQFCLSAQVAEPLQRAGARAVRIAAQPTPSALLDLIGMAEK